MKKLMVVWAWAWACGVAWAYDYDLVDNQLGDSRLVTLGGYTFARPVLVELLPAVGESEDAPARAAYAVRCQVVYKDALLDHPGENEWERVRLTGEVLNGWLEDYLKRECAGLDAAALCAGYLDHEFVKNLQEAFPDYVKTRIAQLAEPSALRVDAVTVTVRAEGAFREELIRLR